MSDLESQLADPKPRRIMDEDYREHIRGLPCLICGAPGEVHHVRSRGAGGGDRQNLVPLCHAHHMEGETRGWTTFEQTHPTRLVLLATVLWASWEKMQNDA